jgi:hypothetical protein
MRGLQKSGIQPLTDHHANILAQLPIQLSGTDVHGVDADGAAL